MRNQTKWGDLSLGRFTDDEAFTMIVNQYIGGGMSCFSEHFPNRYFGWFLDHIIESAKSVTDSGGTIISKLSNTWSYRPDFYDVGRSEEWFSLSNPRHDGKR
jgi:hypothetical protein